MENNSPGGTERPVEVGLSNGPSFRGHSGRPKSTMSNTDVSPVSPVAGNFPPMSSPPPLPPHHPHHYHYQQTTTITVNKDENGYGMKVSGDNPVYVQSVKEGGAAEKAGLHSGDKIIRVNGIDVAHSTHSDVVELIKASTQVTLTVQQRPSHSNPLSSPAMATRPFFHSHSTPSREHITGPRPVDHEKKRQFRCQRDQTYRLMLEEEQRYVDVLRSELVRCSDSANESKLMQELTGAERRVRTLQEKLLTPTSKQHGLSHSHSSGHNHDGEHALTHATTLSTPSVHNTVAAVLENNREEPGQTPPPLPQRNRPSNSGSNGAPPRPAQANPPSTPTHTGLPGLSYLDPPPLPPHPLLNSPDQGGESFPGSPTNSHGPQASQSSIHTHHRAKSSPDPLTNMSNAEASKRLIVSESLSDLSNPKRKCGWDLDSPQVTPPGTPPPPYGGNTNVSTDRAEGADTTEDGHDETCDSSESCQQRSHQIISMEDDDMSDQEVLEDHGPFKSLSKLWEHNAHLAVFMNYVISNSDPSSLLFYLLTDLYKEGNAKEMKKWAYEIHSSFLVPGAPLRLTNVDENVAREIDDVLLKDSEKEEILRRVFLKARAKAKEELNDQLADFQQKRTAGLGTLFGPADGHLDESIHDKGKEMRIIESILVPKIEPYLDDIEKDNVEHVDSRRYTTAAALGTVMGKVFGLRGPHSSALLERCPTFVSKDKLLKARITGKIRKVSIRGHNLNLHQYYIVTFCNHCHYIICGIGPQGYQCSHCGLNVHRRCVRIMEENCPGPMVKKEKGNASISKLMDRIREREPRRKPSSLNLKRLQYGYIALVASSKKNGYGSRNRFFNRVSGYRKSLVKRQSDQNDENSNLGDGDGASGDRPAGRLTDRRDKPDSVSEERQAGAGGPGAGGSAAGLAGGGATGPAAAGAGTGQDRVPAQEDDHPQQLSVHHMPKPKPSSTAINRSESYKERVSQKRQLRERRKTSDPNLSKSKHVEDKNSLAPSSSSRHPGRGLHNLHGDRKSDADLEAPATALTYHSGSSSNSSLSTRSLDSPSNSLEVVAVQQSSHWDSDIDADQDPPDWTRGVSEEVLKGLSVREKKRQDVINELFHTEKSHVRNLKVLDLVFCRPMCEAGVLPPDQLSLLFSNLDQMIEIHSTFNNNCKAKRRENPVVGNVDDLLLSMFDGPAGEEFQQAAATFCARQQIALESLKERRKKDAKLNNFLCEAEGNPMCRRLQLKDILPSGMLRLTKYPLLFENLAKYTSSGADSQEYTSVVRALERSKEILNHVNGAVREAEDHQRLLDIQKRLDRSAFEKADHAVSKEFRNLDITKHRLIHEGPLNWRIGNRQKFIDLHVLLLEDIIILLQRQDEKYLLKFYNVNTTVASSNERPPTLSPIIKVSTVLVRPNAVDKKALYLVNTSVNGAQIYDLVASSSAERKSWFNHISEAAEKYKTDNKHRRSELISVPPDDSAESQNEKSKESEDFVSSPVQVTTDDDVGGGSPSEIGNPSSPTSGLSNSSSNVTGANNSVSPTTNKGDLISSPSLRRRGEPLRLTTEESPLIEPSEVTVSQRSVLTAEPVLTPIEKLRRKDDAIRNALIEKQQLVADILHIPREDFNTIAEMAAQPSQDKEAAEVVLAAINQANLLSSLLNESLRISEEDTVVATSGTSPRQNRRSTCMPSVPCNRVMEISTSINAELTQLLKMMKERDEERERLRRELQRSREQLHVMHESQRRRESRKGLANSAEQSEDPGSDQLTQQTEQSPALPPAAQCSQNVAGLSEDLQKLSLSKEDEFENSFNSPLSSTPNKIVRDSIQVDNSLSPSLEAGQDGEAAVSEADTL